MITGSNRDYIQNPNKIGPKHITTIRQIFGLARKIALKAKTAEAGTLPSYTRLNRPPYHILFTYGYIQNPNQIGLGTSQRFDKYLALYEKKRLYSHGGAGWEQDSHEFPTKFSRNSPQKAHEIPTKFPRNSHECPTKFPRNSHEIPPGAKFHQGR
jgi:hypothetical protein